MKQDVFEKYPVPKAVGVMALPTVLSMLVNVFYNMADTLFVGWTKDPNQVAAVSLTTPVFLLLMAIGNMFGIGGSSYISRLLGEGNNEKVKRVSAFCFYGSIVAGILMTIIFLAGMPGILRMIGASENTYGFAEEYLTYVGWGAVFVVFSSAFGNIVRGEGASTISMLGMMIGTIVNIVLDPIMILGLHMGVAGAGVATVIGNVCATVFYLIYLVSKKTCLSVAPKHFTLRDQVLTGVFKIGIPASMNNVLMSASNIVLNIYLVSYSDAVVAAMGVAMKANMLIVLTALGLGMGVQPLVGYSYGAGNVKRMKKVMKFGMLCNVIMGSMVTVLYFIFAKQVIGIFIDNTAVISHGVPMLRALMISAPFIGIMFVFNFSFQAMGKALPSVILSLGRQGLFFFPILILGNIAMGLDGIIYAQPLADLASIVIALIMFLIINKELKNKEQGVQE